jgi:dyslexia susceptibility 1 candidate gene 1 protein
LSFTPREATERQIELERKRRQEIENRKKQELEDERRHLEDWQRKLSSKAHDTFADVLDDSDYESEDEIARVGPPASAHPMPDHPEYHGKGWRPTNSR